MIGTHPREISIDQSLQLVCSVCIVSQCNRTRMSKCSSTIGLWKCMCMGMLLYRLITTPVQALLLKIWSSEEVVFWIFLMCMLVHMQMTAASYAIEGWHLHGSFGEEGVSCLQRRSYTGCGATAHHRIPITWKQYMQIVFNYKF